MRSSDSSRFSRAQIDNQIKQFAISQSRSMQLVHLVGYGILLLIFIDWLVILLPPRFMNPSWEFQAFGQCIERVPVLFLGLILSFFGEDNPRGKYERIVVRILSWFTLLLAIASFLLVPVSIFNTIRIDQTNEQRANFELDQKLSQNQRLKTQVDQAKSLEDFSGVSALLQARGSTTNGSTSDVAQSKEQLYALLKNQEKLFLAENNRDIRREHRALIKLSFKWNVGAVISGILLLLIWVNTRWARL